MAEVKKPSGGGGDQSEILILVAILFLIGTGIYAWFTGFINERGIEISIPIIIDFAYRVTNPIRIVSLILSALFLFGIIFLSIKTGKLMNKRSKLTHSHSTKESEEVFVNKKWEKIVLNLESNNPGDWKLAILEADIVLGEMLEKMGYRGDSIGEKLKNIEKSDFNTLDIAWQAHKVRNNIAHKGSEFNISKDEAIKTIELYEKVFKEFRFI